MSNLIKTNNLKRIKNGSLDLGFGMSQPHQAEMPIYFLVKYLGKAVTPKLANTKIDQYPSVFFSPVFLSSFCIYFTLFLQPRHVYMCEKTSESLRYMNKETKTVSGTVHGEGITASDWMDCGYLTFPPHISN